MDFELKLSPDQLQVTLRQLDVGQHNVVRPVIDAILAQVKAQQEMASRAQGAFETAMEAVKPAP